MSDLIRRKKIRDYIKGEINPYGKPFEGTAYELGLKIMRYIDAMDSDYDLDKVVEELEIERKTANNTYNSFNMDVDLGRVFGLEKAIEIVKAGQCVRSRAEVKGNGE